MRKLLANFICLFIPKKEQRKRIRSALLLGGYKILGGVIRSLWRKMVGNVFCGKRNESPV